MKSLHAAAVLLCLTVPGAALATSFYDVAATANIYASGLSTTVQLALWIPFVIVFPLWFFRYSRSLWLALAYLLNPEP